MYHIVEVLTNFIGMLPNVLPQAQHRLRLPSNQLVLGMNNQGQVWRTQDCTRMDKSGKGIQPQVL